MGSAWAGLVAVAAALCYAAASVLQFREADASTEGSQVRLAGLVGLFARPLWLAGMAVDALGLGLHVLALGLGPVSVVQPLQVASLLFALPLGAALSHRRITRRECGAAALVVAGVALFLAAARPGQSTRGFSPVVAATLSAATLVLLAVGAVAVRRSSPRLRSVILGGESGAGFAVAAVLLGALSDTRARHGWAALARPEQIPALLGLLAVGATALVLSQAAFQLGHLGASLPSLTVVDPALAVVLGAVLLGERLHLSVLTGIGVAAGLALVTAGVTDLARFRQESSIEESRFTGHAGGPEPPPPSRRPPARAVGLGVVGAAVIVTIAEFVGTVVDRDDTIAGRALVAGIAAAGCLLVALVLPALQRRRGQSRSQ